MLITPKFNVNFHRTTRKFRPNVIRKVKPQKKPKTVVVFPDGTIDESPFAKIRQKFDECIMAVIEKMFF